MKLRNIITTAIFTLVLFSCIKEENTEPDKQGKDQVKWTFSLYHELGNEVLTSAIPAFDEKNKGYYLVNTDNTGANDINNRHDVWLLAIREDSILNWKVKVSDSPVDAQDVNYVSYISGKVLVFLTNKLVCLDTLNGNTVWSKDIHRVYWQNSLSVSKGKIFYIDQSDTRDKLKGLNLADGSEICSIGLNSSTNEDVRGELTVIAGDKLYVSTSDINNSGQWLTKIFIYDIANISNSSAPLTYTLPSDYFPKNTMAVNSSGDLLFFMKNDISSPYKKYLVSISQTGTENWKAEVPDDAKYIYIDNQNLIHCRTTSTIKIIRYSNTGNKLNENSFQYYNTFPTFEILEDNTVYGNVEDSETGLSTFATFDLNSGNEKANRSINFPYSMLEGSSIAIQQENQEREADNAEFTDAFVKSVDRKGNLIAISRYKIYCIKDLDQKLLPDSWPKDFSNYGNTNSR